MSDEPFKVAVDTVIPALRKLFYSLPDAHKTYAAFAAMRSAERNERPLGSLPFPQMMEEAAADAALLWSAHHEADEQTADITVKIAWRCLEIGYHRDGKSLDETLSAFVAHNAVDVMLCIGYIALAETMRQLIRANTPKNPHN